MSWIQKLYETYEACANREASGSAELMPICHTLQQAQIEIVIDDAGNFRRARVLDKTEATTLIPCTEESGGRAGSKPVNHPLCDKLQYVAGDFNKFGGMVTSGFAGNPSEPHSKFVTSLTEWAGSRFGHPKLDAILKYVKKARLIADLTAHGVLPVHKDGTLVRESPADRSEQPAIFKAIQATQGPQDAFVRWQVETIGDPVSATWDDKALIAAWIGFFKSRTNVQGICMVTGQESALAFMHPAKIRHGGDKAKLISSNDGSGFTYRGRFSTPDQAASVGFEVTQKAHNALRWLLSRQGFRNGDQVFVTWAIDGSPAPDPMKNTLELFGAAVAIGGPADVAYTAQDFAIRLNKAIAGYRANLDGGTDLVIMGLDSATPGRMAIIYYRELRGSDFLDRVERWHTTFAWPQSYSGQTKFVGAPSPRDIAEAAHGPRLDERLKKSCVERLLPCIVDQQGPPQDLILSCVRRACNRGALDAWEWERTLGIACALYKGYHQQRSYEMSLETERRTRDYLYGRLLAAADDIESLAHFAAGEKGRDTHAARLMQRFSDRPFSAWRTIELGLSPYRSRLKVSRPGALSNREKLIDEIMNLFSSADFGSDAPLSGEFLLGFHCQRSALRSATAGPKPNSSPAIEQQENEASQ